MLVIDISEKYPLAICMKASETQALIIQADKDFCDYEEDYTNAYSWNWDKISYWI